MYSEKKVNNEGNLITFPVYLVEGDNGQLGVDLFNYITDKMIEKNNNIYILGAEKVYVNGVEINQFCSNAPVSLVKLNVIYYNGHPYYYIYSPKWTC